MRNTLIAIVSMCIATAIPYLLVAVAWICSLATFSYTATVTHHDFYAFSGIYWICIAWAVAKAIYNELGGY